MIQVTKEEAQKAAEILLKIGNETFANAAAEMVTLNTEATKLIKDWYFNYMNGDIPW